MLQEAGYEVFGLYLDIGAESARADAQAAAECLGVPLTVLDISAALEKNVCIPFVEGYLRGETPNPCILCNPKVKFSALTAVADGLGAEHIATGHYARAEDGALYCGMPANDQSYMLCRLTRNQLARLVLPLGSMEKRETRELAREFGLPVANKPDSMEICFIPDGDYSAWISRRAVLPGPGRFLRDGTEVGKHAGIHQWTVGQRIPGVFDDGQTKLYVSAIDPASGDISVCPNEGLLRTEFSAREFNWLVDVPQAPVRGSVRVRHTRNGGQTCTAEARPDGSVRFLCETPVRAPAPGQSAVLYDGDRVLGGGFIV
ncbi:MAG: tRNA 2-thiouridine(34) synthase MnmA [Oscillospiraceae bacterium]|nr:tRNA 2-thiouridine(34) synthase MnmA [Oscillospiraceae bacterium]